MLAMDEIRPVWLEVNLNNLESNFNNIKEIVPDGTNIMVVLKANAYGHGAIELAKMYKKLGADRIAVSILFEALEMRRAGITGDILLLNYSPKSQLSQIVENDITQAIYSFDDAEALSKVALAKDKIAKIHLKIDTGMGRIGFLPNDESIKEIVRINKLPNLEIEGIFSHFAKADEKDKEYTKTQYEKFKWFVSKLEESGIYISIKHISNSASIIDFPEYNLDMVRPGIILYGYYPSGDVHKSEIDLKPALTLKGKISHIKTVAKDTGIGYGHIYSTSRESTIATIPIGYADGYSRMLSGKGFVYIKNKRVPIVGRICMDQLMIDVTDVENVKIGDEVVFFGTGNEYYPSVEEIASLLGTVNYELICMISRRIPRVYFKDNKISSIKDYLID